jgi:hypothetical protein
MPWGEILASGQVQNLKVSGVGLSGSGRHSGFSLRGFERHNTINPTGRACKTTELLSGSREGLSIRNGVKMRLLACRPSAVRNESGIT